MQHLMLHDAITHYFLDWPMKRNSRLSLALHTLGHMAGDPGRRRTSAEIAKHNSTNPVVVRRVLGMLREARLLDSEKGHAGGWRLAKAPESITLADVYMALGEQMFQDQGRPEKIECSVEHGLFDRVSSVLEEVETVLIERFSSTSIADIAKPAD